MQQHKGKSNNIENLGMRKVMKSKVWSLHNDGNLATLHMR